MNNLPTDKNRRVLVIDDNHAIHDDFRKILSPATAATAALDATEAAVFGRSTNAVEQAQFEVDSAYQGQEGVELVKKALAAGQPYAMAFVDVRMPPGWDGLETTRKIWELDPNLQVVLCTAYSDYSWGEMFAKLGQRDGLLILKKPFDAVEAFQLAHALTEKWWLHQQSQRKRKCWRAGSPNAPLNSQTQTKPCKRRTPREDRLRSNAIGSSRTCKNPWPT
jgi:CheY-like chemotaxis protein